MFVSGVPKDVDQGRNGTTTKTGLLEWGGARIPSGGPETSSQS